MQEKKNRLSSVYRQFFHILYFDQLFDMSKASLIVISVFTSIGLLIDRRKGRLKLFNYLFAYYWKVR